jgi:orotidine-5'-phosphate decarboxylase
MSDHFADRLLAAIDRKGAPVCVGIDPILNMMPAELFRSADARTGADIDAALDAVHDFVSKVLQVVAPLVPCVKFQSAYFEQFYHEGVEAYYALIQEATELGLIVIGDVKRGDIGSTAQAYAAAHLTPPPVRAEADEEIGTPDAITVNPMLGFDTLEPFLSVADQYDKGLFVLVRTSNPGSAELQDLRLADGRTWSENLAARLHTLAAADHRIGRSGWSNVGAVVGATQTHTMERLRELLPNSIFLLPGYGTQGATADMTRAAFRAGQGALVSASRSILYAHRDKEYAGMSWDKAVEAATLAMRNDLESFAAK